MQRPRRRRAAARPSSDRRDERAPRSSPGATRMRRPVAGVNGTAEEELGVVRDARPPRGRRPLPVAREVAVRAARAGTAGAAATSRPAAAHGEVARPPAASAPRPTRSPRARRGTRGARTGSRAPARGRGARPTPRPRARRSTPWTESERPVTRAVHSGRARRDATRRPSVGDTPAPRRLRAGAVTTFAVENAPRDAYGREPRRPARRGPPGRRGVRGRLRRSRRRCRTRSTTGRRASPRCAPSPTSLDAGRVHAEPLDPARLLSPLPRAYEWVDGSAYLNHVRLVRKARGAEPPPTLETDPLVYQGGSGVLLAPVRGHPAPRSGVGPRLRGGGLRRPRRRAARRARDGRASGTSGSSASRTTSRSGTSSRPSSRRASASSSRSRRPRSRRSRSRPTSSATRGAAAAPTCGSRCAGTARVVGDFDAGPRCTSRSSTSSSTSRRRARFTAGTILGSGTVSNADRARGFSCLAERRALEMIEHGEPRTRFLEPGDRDRDRGARRGGPRASSARSASGWWRHDDAALLLLAVLVGLARPHRARAQGPAVRVRRREPPRAGAVRRGVPGAQPDGAGAGARGLGGRRTPSASRSRWRSSSGSRSATREPPLLPRGSRRPRAGPRARRARELRHPAAPERDRAPDAAARSCRGTRRSGRALWIAPRPRRARARGCRTAAGPLLPRRRAGARRLLPRAAALRRAPLRRGPRAVPDAPRGSRRRAPRSPPFQAAHADRQPDAPPPDQEDDHDTKLEPLGIVRSRRCTTTCTTSSGAAASTWSGMDFAEVGALDPSSSARGASAPRCSRRATSASSARSRSARAGAPGATCASTPTASAR